MDKSGLYQYVFCIDNNVLQRLKYSIETLIVIMNFRQTLISIHLQIRFRVMNGAKCPINIKSIVKYIVVSLLVFLLIGIIIVCIL